MFKYFVRYTYPSFDYNTIITESDIIVSDSEFEDIFDVRTTVVGLLSWREFKQSDIDIISMNRL